MNDKMQVCAAMAKSISEQRTYIRASRVELKRHNVRAARFWLECYREARNVWDNLNAMKGSK